MSKRDLTMAKGTSADQATSANDYTFEQYDNPSESRTWLERFLHEHNGKDWRRKLEFSVADLVSGNLPKGPNGETIEIFWYRILYKGVSVGYLDAKIQPIFNGRKVISDVWILPRFRNRGHFHDSFPALVEHTQAAGVCLMLDKYRLYGSWFESFGYKWLCGVGTHPGSTPENSPLFLVTRDAYKDAVRFLIKHVGGSFYPGSDAAKVIHEEVRRELERNDAGGG